MPTKTPAGYGTATERQVRSRPAILAACTVAVLAVCATVLVVVLDHSEHKRESVREPTGQGIVIGDKRGRRTHTGSQTAQLHAAERSARSFLGGYLPLIYGRPHARVDELGHAEPTLVHSLARNPGRVPPTQARLTPRIVSVASVLQAAGAAQVTATIKDQDTPPFPIVMYVDRQADGRWLVARLGDD